MIHVSKVEKQPTPKMTNTFQTNIQDSNYNGWANYETWNVSLWIQNDQSIYDAAKGCDDYSQLVEMFYDCGVKETPDGVSFTDPKLNQIELNEMIQTL